MPESKNKDGMILLREVKLLLNYTRQLYVKGRVPNVVKAYELPALMDKTIELYAKIRQSVEKAFLPVPEDTPYKDKLIRQNKDNARKAVLVASDLLVDIKVRWEVLVGIEIGQFGDDTIIPIPYLKKRREPVYKQLSEVSKLLRGWLNWLS